MIAIRDSLVPSAGLLVYRVGRIDNEYDYDHGMDDQEVVCRL